MISVRSLASRAPDAGGQLKATLQSLQPGHCEPHSSLLLHVSSRREDWCCHDLLPAASAARGVPELRHRHAPRAHQGADLGWLSVRTFTVQTAFRIALPVAKVSRRSTVCVRARTRRCRWVRTSAAEQRAIMRRHWQLRLIHCSHHQRCPTRVRPPRPTSQSCCQPGR